MGLIQYFGIYRTVSELVYIWLVCFILSESELMGVGLPLLYIY